LARPGDKRWLVERLEPELLDASMDWLLLLFDASYGPTAVRPVCRSVAWRQMLGRCGLRE
jgi:hypothetical protein